MARTGQQCWTIEIIEYRIQFQKTSSIQQEVERSKKMKPDLRTQGWRERAQQCTMAHLADILVNMAKFIKTSGPGRKIPGLTIEDQ